MKRKFLEWNTYQENIKTKERITFGLKSPFPSITLPPKTIFAGWHGTLLPNIVVSGAQGTFYICRSDIHNLTPFKFDMYSIFSTKDKVQLEIISQKLEYHWTKDIPVCIEEQMPRWVQNRI